MSIFSFKEIYVEDTSHNCTIYIWGNLMTDSATLIKKKWQVFYSVTYNLLWERYSCWPLTPSQSPILFYPMSFPPGSKLTFWGLKITLYFRVRPAILSALTRSTDRKDATRKPWTFVRLEARKQRASTRSMAYPNNSFLIKGFLWPRSLDLPTLSQVLVIMNTMAHSLAMYRIFLMRGLTKKHNLWERRGKNLSEEKSWSWW